MKAHEVNGQMDRILISSIRLRKLAKMGAPAIVLRNDMRLLQISLVDLFQDSGFAQSIEDLEADQPTIHLN